MQRKQMWILNLALAGFALLMALRLAGDWKRGNERYRTLNQRVQIAALPVMPAVRNSPGDTDIVSRNLFSPDRNNNRAQVQQAPPPLPVVMGTMRLGDGYEALMSEGGSAVSAARFRRVKEGEQIGGYTVFKIRDEAIVVDYQGQKSEINVYQSAQSVARTVAAAAPVTMSQGTTAGPVVESAASTVNTTPPPLPNTFPASTTDVNRQAAPGMATNTPEVKVTIEGNRKRFERYTAFGPQVWYEDIK